MVSVSLFNCEDTLEPSALDYIAFGTDKYSTGVDPGGATTFDIPVYTAKVYSAATTFNVTVDGAKAAAGSYDVPASVSIAAGSNEGVLTVSLSDVNLGIGINAITINFKDEAGSYHGESTTLAYVQNCTDITATLDLSFDRWGSEVYSEIRDSLDGLVTPQANTHTPKTAVGFVLFFVEEAHTQYTARARPKKRPRLS